MDKDMTFHELYDHMKGNCCPICSLIKKSTRKLVDSFLYECVNDSIIRAQIKKSRGMCNYHAYMLVELGDPLAHAIIYSDLLEQAKKDVREKTSDALTPYVEHEGCYFCKSARNSESIYVKCFASAFSDDNFSRR